MEHGPPDGGIVGDAAPATDATSACVALAACCGHLAIAEFEPNCRATAMGGSAARCTELLEDPLYCAHR